MQAFLRMILLQVENTPMASFAKPAVLLEPELCWSLKLQWQDETSDTYYIFSKAESSDKLNQPVAINHYIVISKDRNAFPRLLKVNAITGKSEPFYDAGKMQAAFASLPPEIQAQARKAYRLWQQNHRHPSLHFEPKGDYWSVRITRGWRALGRLHDVGRGVEIRDELDMVAKSVVR